MKRQIVILVVIMFFASCKALTARANSEATEIRTQSWVLPLTTEYHARKEEGIYELYRENAVGALQLSSMAKRSKITDTEILEIAKSQVGNKGELIDISAQNIRGYRSSYEDEGVFWIYWFIVIDRSLILITYNTVSDEINEDEIKEVEALVSGLSST